jgi:hypothetical protein
MTEFPPGKPGAYEGGRASPGLPPLPYQHAAAGSSGFISVNPRDEYELSRFDSQHDQAPLLANPQPYVHAGMASDSQLSFAPQPQYPPASIADMGGAGYREAPLHRPYPPSREQSGYAPSSYSQAGYSPSGMYPPPPQQQQDFNMAGRGAHRG